MADFQHFLVLVDGSPASLKAYEKAVYLTETCKSQVTLLYVIDMNHELSVFEQVGTGGYLPGEFMHKGRTLVEQVRNHIADQCPVSTVVKMGAPTQQILDYCTNHPRIDCIIMGNRGFGKLKQMLLGSVSQNIIVHAPLPVMTVKETEWEKKA